MCRSPELHSYVVYEQSVDFPGRPKRTLNALVRRIHNGAHPTERNISLSMRVVALDGNAYQF